MTLPLPVTLPTPLERLYRDHGPALYRLAYRLTSSREDAEDTVHDVFVGLPAALDGYRERGRLESWLKRVTARVALMRLRSRRRRREVDLVEIAIEPAASGRADSLSLQAAVDALPDTLRCVVVLKEIEGYSHAEIAGILGISRVASRVRLARALRQLRTKLEGREKQS
jgi:RNA polymerase sigma-70 factor (ECF subfamily)